MHIRKLDEIWRGKSWNKLPSVTCPKEEKASLRDFSSADHDNPETTSFYDLSVTVKTGDWAYGVTGERERERGTSDKELVRGGRRRGCRR